MAEGALGGFEIFFELRDAHALGLADVGEAFAGATFVGEKFATGPHDATGEIADDVAIFGFAETGDNDGAGIAAGFALQAGDMTADGVYHRGAFNGAGLGLRLTRRHFAGGNDLEDFFENRMAGRRGAVGRKQGGEVQFTLRHGVVVTLVAVFFGERIQGGEKSGNFPASFGGGRGDGGERGEQNANAADGAERTAIGVVGRKHAAA